MEGTPTTLLDLLSNQLVLRQISPYIPTKDVINLSSANRNLRHLVCNAPEAFQYLDLSPIRSAAIDISPIDSGGTSWRAERMDEALTEDEFYCGPLRGVFNKLRQQHILQYVHTLILDGLSVPADLVREIIAEDRFNVRILSVRQCKHLNERKLNQVLRYAVRPSRSTGTPKLRGLYFFGPKDAPINALSQTISIREEKQRIMRSGVTLSEGAQIGAAWDQLPDDAVINRSEYAEDQLYRSVGRIMKTPVSDWGATLDDCKGLIAFDAVLCRGPRHSPHAGANYLPPAIATVSLKARGCQSCGTCPEGPVVFGESPETDLPLLAPPPIHSTRVRTAQRPSPISTTSSGRHRMPSLIMRCEDCLRGRWCERCNKWWCETCYSEPVSRASEPAQALDSAALTDLMGPNPSLVGQVKVLFNVCVESCLRSEILPVVDGMWG